MNRLFYFSFILLCLFPVIPNKLKGLPIILFFVSCLILFIKTKEKKMNGKLILINSGILVFYLISLIYSEDLNRAYNLLERSVSLLAFPLIFYWFLNGKKWDKKDLAQLKSKLFHTYILATLTYACIIVLNFFFFKDPYTTFPMNIYVRASVLHIPFIGIHPIYSSMILAIGLLFSASNLYDSKKKIYLIPIILFLTLIMMIAGKATILALFISVLCIFLIKGKRKIIIPVILFFILLGYLIPPIKSRSEELFKLKTYTEIDNANSSSIRYYLNKSSLDILKDNWVFGIGIGDVKAEVTRIFQSKYHGKETFASHNQFLSIWLGTGIFGFLMFLFMMFYNFRLALKSSDLLFLSLLILFTVHLLTENILEKQTGIILFAFLVHFFGFIHANEEKLRLES